MVDGNFQGVSNFCNRLDGGRDITASLRAAPGPGDLFNMKLSYNTPTANGGAAQFNGNISEVVAPKAFLNWIVFDRDFNMLDGGFVQVSTAARETGTDIPHERLAKDNIVITKPGYVYIYLSNENGDLVDDYSGNCDPPIPGMV